MKFFLFFLVMWLFCHALQAQILNEYEFYDLQLRVLRVNKIKREKCFKYKISHDGKVDSSLVWASDFTYGDSKSVIEKIEGRAKKISVFYEINFNDADAVSKRELRITKNSTLIDRLSEEYDYDSLGRVTYEVRYNMDTTQIMKFKKTYNAEGKWINTLYKRESKLPINADLFLNMRSFKLHDSLFYDQDGKLNNWQYYNYLGKKAELYLYNYEGIDEKTVTIVEQLADTQHIISQTKYNKTGLVIQTLKFDDPFKLFPDEDITVEKYLYNNDGTVNTALGYLNGHLAHMYKYFYDH